MKPAVLYLPGNVKCRASILMQYENRLGFTIMQIKKTSINMRIKYLKRDILFITSNVPSAQFPNSL